MKKLFQHTWYPFLMIMILTLHGCTMPRGPVPLSGEVPEAEGWNSEVVVDGLVHPWSIVWVPGEQFDMLITERPGRIRIVQDGVLQARTISGLPEIFVSGQAGLLDISLHPEFEENRLVYLTYATGDEESNRTTVGRGTLDGFSLTGFEEIFRVNDNKTGDQHFGSRILWTTETTFLLSLADGGNYIRFEGEWIREQAQNPESHLGKVLKLTEDGDPAPDGPFLKDVKALPEIWTLGHRNIQGLALDPGTGRVWANEHGSRGGDELNLLKAGANYGWPEVTYSREYHYTKISDETSGPGMEDPKIVWTPAQAPSGLVFYTGNRFPGWKGNLFSGGLKGEQVRRIVLEGESVQREESIPLGRRVRSVVEGPDEYLYVLTDHEDGELIRIIPSQTGE